MLDPLFSFFEKLISEFSWKRLFFTLSAIAIVVSSVILYEIYTAHFQINRMGKELELLVRLLELSRADEIKVAPSLQRTYNALAQELEILVITGTTSSTSSLATNIPAWLWRAIYSAIPWMILAIVLLFYSKEPENRSTMIGGLVVMATPFIAVGAVLPEFDKLWINYWIIPWSTVLIFVVCILLWNRRKKMEK